VYYGSSLQQLACKEASRTAQPTIKYYGELLVIMSHTSFIPDELYFGKQPDYFLHNRV